MRVKMSKQPPTSTYRKGSRSLPYYVSMHVKNIINSELLDGRGVLDDSYQIFYISGCALCYVKYKRFYYCASQLKS